jgi:hypothetical protein
MERGVRMNPTTFLRLDPSSLDPSVLDRVVTRAHAAVTAKHEAGLLDDRTARGWLRAIAHADMFLRTFTGTLLVGSDGSVVVPSASSEVLAYTTYTTVACGCPSRHGWCWHRALARIVQQYRQTAPTGRRAA